jgi:hypothetical protein
MDHKDSLTNKQKKIENQENELLKIFINSNLSKYNSKPSEVDYKAVNDIIYDEKKRLVSIFKDYLLLDEVSEFLKRYYLIKESPQRISKICEYYEKFAYTVPNYANVKQQNILIKNIKRKRKVLENMNIKKEDKVEEDDEEKAKYSTFIKFDNTTSMIESHIYNKIPSTLQETNKINESKCSRMHIFDHLDLDKLDKKEKAAHLIHEDQDRPSKLNEYVKSCNILNDDVSKIYKEENFYDFREINEDLSLFNRSYSYSKHPSSKKNIFLLGNDLNIESNINETHKANKTTQPIEDENILYELIDDSEVTSKIMNFSHLDMSQNNKNPSDGYGKIYAVTEENPAESASKAVREIGKKFPSVFNKNQMIKGKETVVDKGNNRIKEKQTPGNLNKLKENKKLLNKKITNHFTTNTQGDFKKNSIKNQKITPNPCQNMYLKISRGKSQAREITQNNLKQKLIQHILNSKNNDKDKENKIDGKELMHRASMVESAGNNKKPIAQKMSTKISKENVAIFNLDCNGSASPTNRKISKSGTKSKSESNTNLQEKVNINMINATTPNNLNTNQTINKLSTKPNKDIQPPNLKNIPNINEIIQGNIQQMGDNINNPKSPTNNIYNISVNFNFNVKLNSKDENKLVNNAVKKLSTPKQQALKIDYVALSHRSSSRDTIVSSGSINKKIIQKGTSNTNSHTNEPTINFSKIAQNPLITSINLIDTPGNTQQQITQHKSLNNTLSKQTASSVEKKNKLSFLNLNSNGNTTFEANPKLQKFTSSMSTTPTLKKFINFTNQIQPKKFNQNNRLKNDTMNTRNLTNNISRRIDRSTNLIGNNSNIINQGINSNISEGGENSCVLNTYCAVNNGNTPKNAMPISVKISPNELLNSKRSFTNNHNNLSLNNIPFNGAMNKSLTKNNSIGHNKLNSRNSFPMKQSIKNMGIGMTNNIANSNNINKSTTNNNFFKKESNINQNVNNFLSLGSGIHTARNSQKKNLTFQLKFINK